MKRIWNGINAWLDDYSIFVIMFLIPVLLLVIVWAAVRNDHNLDSMRNQCQQAKGHVEVVRVIPGKVPLEIYGCVK